MRFRCVGVFEGAQFYPAGPCRKLQRLLEILAHSNVVHPDILSRITRTAMVKSSHGGYARRDSERTKVPSASSVAGGASGART